MIAQEPERFYHTLEWRQVYLAQRKIYFNTPHKSPKLNHKLTEQGLCDRAIALSSRSEFLVLKTES